MTRNIRNQTSGRSDMGLVALALLGSGMASVAIAAPRQNVAHHPPASAPVYHAPAPSHVPAQARPSAPAHVPTPVYHAPAPAPAYHAPAPAPAYRAPAPTPVYHAPTPVVVRPAPAVTPPAQVIRHEPKPPTPPAIQQPTYQRAHQGTMASAVPHHSGVRPESPASVSPATAAAPAFATRPAFAPPQETGYRGGYGHGHGQGYGYGMRREGDRYIYAPSTFVQVDAPTYQQTAVVNDSRPAAIVSNSRPALVTANDGQPAVYQPSTQPGWIAPVGREWCPYAVLRIGYTGICWNPIYERCEQYANSAFGGVVSCR